MERRKRRKRRGWKDGKMVVERALRLWRFDNKTETSLSPFELVPNPPSLHEEETSSTSCAPAAKHVALFTSLFIHFSLPLVLARSSCLSLASSRVH